MSDFGDSKIRQAAVAGVFYPDVASQLRDEIEALLKEAKRLDAEPTAATLLLPTPKAIIVPHAGYCYSGKVAAAAFKQVQGRNIRRVILLGPSHRVALMGCALPTSQVFQTPMGNIPVDQAICHQLVEAGLGHFDDPPHRLEHSLEVQLPFLQHSLTDFEIVPIVAGLAEAKPVADLLASLSLSSEDLLVISTDLSHFHSYRDAKALDDKTIARILALDTSIGPQDACGCYSVNGFLHFVKHKLGSKAHDFNPTLKLLAEANSGDAEGGAGAMNRVVGYASFALY